MTSAAGSKPKAMQLKPTMEALGVVLAFICREQPYSEFRAAKIIAAVQHQLTARCHVCLIVAESARRSPARTVLGRSEGGPGEPRPPEEGAER